jgi:hypothetical protein
MQYSPNGTILGQTAEDGEAESLANNKESYV